MAKKKDNAANIFFSMDVNAVSLFNGKLHDGHQVLKPDDLMEADSAERTKRTNGQYRDVVKRVAVKSSGRLTYRIIGIESQSYDDMMMVLRNLVYDASRYDRQYRALRSCNKQNKVEGVGPLSGVRDDDTVNPVMTIMVNLSGEPWRSPRRLSELFSIDDEQLLKYVNDYEMAVVDPYAMKAEELERYTGEVGMLFSLLAYKDDMEAHSRYIMSLKDSGDVISDEAWTMLEEYAGFSDMDRDSIVNEEHKVVVSKAIEYRVQQAVNDAVTRTREKMQEQQERMAAEQKRMVAEQNMLRSALVGLMKDNSVSRSTMADYLGVSVEEVDSILCEKEPSPM